MENVTAVDFLKLRASYGLTASLGPATNSNIVLRSITTNRTFPTERESVIKLANLENSNLTWEKITKQILASMPAYLKEGLI